MRVWLQPRAYERRYGRFLRKTAAQAHRELLARLGGVIRAQRINPQFERDYSDPLFTSGTVSEDSDEIAFIIAGLLAWWRASIVGTRDTIRGYYNITNQFNDRQFREVVKSATGITLPATASAYRPGQLVSPIADVINRFGDDADIYRAEPYLDGVQKNWVATQESYIDKTVTSAIRDSEVIVRKGIVSSATSGVILGAIGQVFNAVDNRVTRAASDEINNLDIVLSEQRQKSLGANEYIWRTMRDERVRGTPGGLYPKAKPSHFAREGRVFNWNNPPEGGHPGEAPGCRCRAVIRFPR